MRLLAQHTLPLTAQHWLPSQYTERHDEEDTFGVKISIFLSPHGTFNVQFIPTHIMSFGTFVKPMKPFTICLILAVCVVTRGGVRQCNVSIVELIFSMPPCSQVGPYLWTQVPSGDLLGSF